MSDSYFKLSKYITLKEQEEDDEGESGSIIKPSDDFFSMLYDETEQMQNDQRMLEQQGHKRLAKVNQRDRSEKELANNEVDVENNIKAHPLLDNQRFDGIDPNLNPEPPLNSAARKDYDNAQREQEMEKQLRLGNMPQFTSTPKPRPPGS